MKAEEPSARWPGLAGGAAFAGALALAAAMSFTFGGGREGRRAPPSVPSAASTSTGLVPPGKSAASASKGEVGEEVEVRLTHVVDGARVDVPGLARGEGLLAAHWRRMQLPWVSLGALGRRVTTSIALRTSADEKQWAMPKKDGGTWAPDARIWNMNEGSFDQREALFAPTPATYSFPVVVPPAARLTFAAGVAARAKEPVLFAAFAVATEGPERGVEKELCKVTLEVDQKSVEHRRGDQKATEQKAVDQAWQDVSCDLAAFAGRSLELRLKTWTAPAAALETKPGKPPPVAAGPALALFGNPVISVRRPTAVPYNVLFIVVDALRPDVLASFHQDDGGPPPELAALDARLPKVPGLTPVIDELAKKSVIFTRAWSGGAWTRPGTLSMLGGALSSQLGIDPTPWVVPEPQVTAYYRSEPPLLPLLLRGAGVATRAFVNNYFMVGYAAVGVDMGFDRVDDHRYRTRDTKEVTESAVRYLREHKDSRFFTFVNYNSPHEPWEPPDRFLERLPPPCRAAKADAGGAPSASPTPCGPNEDIPRKYMAEAAKDDEAIGVLLQTLDALKLRERTLVVLTADHGETLSAAHAGRSKLDDMAVRFHHAVSNYEETTRIPIVLSLPGVLPEGRVVRTPVSNMDLPPTILELLGRPASNKMTGRSLMPLVRTADEKNVAPRPIVSEGRGTRAILFGAHRLLLREGGARITTVGDKIFDTGQELYDLGVDPGERRDLSSREMARVNELSARLTAFLKREVTADEATKVSAASPPGAGPSAADDGEGVVELRFASGGRGRRFSGTATVPSGSVRAEPIAAPPTALRTEGNKVEFAMTAGSDEVPGVRLRVVPKSAVATLEWQVFLDDAPMPKERFYGGSYGLREASLERGLQVDRARAAAQKGGSEPEIDPARDLGVFVLAVGPASGGASASGGGASAPERGASGAAAAEMTRLLREWGYANKAAPKAEKR